MKTAGQIHSRPAPSPAFKKAQHYADRVKYKSNKKLAARRLFGKLLAAIAGR